jgi:hypothetical protein
VVTEAEREVADPLAIEVDPAVARATVETVPFWFPGGYMPSARFSANVRRADRPEVLRLATFRTAAPRQLRPRPVERESRASRADAVAALQDLGAKRN